MYSFDFFCYSIIFRCYFVIFAVNIFAFQWIWFKIFMIFAYSLFLMTAIDRFNTASTYCRKKDESFRSHVKYGASSKKVTPEFLVVTWDNFFIFQVVARDFLSRERWMRNLASCPLISVFLNTTYELWTNFCGL